MTPHHVWELVVDCRSTVRVVLRFAAINGDTLSAAFPAFIYPNR